ncbi:hypothetical protein GCM10017767_05140 [Halomonas urumqiensis]|nr:hypothetical protein GCM10017767_05140 [Halomonas urumqiensis]
MGQVIYGGKGQSRSKIVARRNASECWAWIKSLQSEVFKCPAGGAAMRYGQGGLRLGPPLGIKTRIPSQPLTPSNPLPRIVECLRTGRHLGVADTSSYANPQIT